MKIPSYYLSCLSVAFAVLAGPHAVRAAAVTMPYTDTFQSTAVGSVPANWITSNGTWAVADNGSQNVYEADNSATGAFLSYLQFSNLGGATNNAFTLTTSFKISDPLTNTSSEYVGFSFLGASATNYFLADIQGSGALRFVAVGGGSLTSSTTANLGATLNASSTYTMTLQGTYVGSTLNLSFTVSDGTLSQTVTATANTPLTGQYFGLRLNNASGGGDNFGVQFNSFAAVPEPGTGALLGLAALGLGVVTFRRRLSR